MLKLVILVYIWTRIERNWEIVQAGVVISDWWKEVTRVLARAVCQALSSITVLEITFIKLLDKNKFRSK